MGMIPFFCSMFKWFVMSSYNCCLIFCCSLSSDPASSFSLLDLLSLCFLSFFFFSFFSFLSFFLSRFLFFSSSVGTEEISSNAFSGRPSSIDPIYEPRLPPTNPFSFFIEDLSRIPDIISFLPPTCWNF